MSGTNLAPGAICLLMPYAMSGTDLAYVRPDLSRPPPVRDVSKPKDNGVQRGERRSRAPMVLRRG
eukprot:3300848-Rhodomonas_salina.2